MKSKTICTIFGFVLLAAFLLGAAGVISVASKTVPESAEADRLIGVFVTTEYLDLFDSERFLHDNIDRLAGGGEISEAERASYQGKLYAELAGTSLNGETGETRKSEEYVFPGVSGMRFFAPHIEDESGVYWGMCTDEGITESEGDKNLFQSADGGESVSLHGTIYIAPTSPIRQFYINPVYETAAGAVYAVSGDGVTLDGDRTPGISVSKTYTAEQTVTENGKETTFGAEVEVTVCVMREPTSYTLLQMNGDHEVLEKNTYRPGALPEEIDVLPDTQYLLLETVSAEGTERTLYGKEDDFISAFFCRSDGICVKQMCRIRWAE